LFLSLVEQSDGSVHLHCDGDLKGSNNAAVVAACMCRFADGLFVGGHQVRLAPEIIKAVL